MLKMHFLFGSFISTVLFPFLSLLFKAGDQYRSCAVGVCGSFLQDLRGFNFVKTTFNGFLPSLQEPSLGKSPWLCLQCLQRAVVTGMLQLHCSHSLYIEFCGVGAIQKRACRVGCLMLAMWYHQKAVWDVWQGIQLHRHNHPYALPVPFAASDAVGHPMQPCKAAWQPLCVSISCSPALNQYIIFLLLQLLFGLQRN